MELELLGFFSAIIIGTTLGLIGGGGSILTVPVLVYFFGIPPVTATAYSLFIVGASSLFGTVNYFKRGLLDLRTALIFSVPSFIAVFLTRRFFIPSLPNELSMGPQWIEHLGFALVLFIGLFIATQTLRKSKWLKGNPSQGKVLTLMIPAATMVFIMRQYVIPTLPEVLLHNERLTVTKDDGIMILFALIMLFAALSMIRGKKEVTESPTQEKKYDYPLIMIEGMVVGTLTGVVGAGGGFLIIPALVLLAKLPMKYAVGTSLLIITIKSLIGFLGDLQHQNIDWPFLLGFTGLSLGGILIGNKLSQVVPGKQLKKGFGYFVLLMALILLFKQFV